MPFASEQQRKAMFAAAEGHSTLGIPKEVGEKFIRHDCPSLDSIRKDMEDYFSARKDAEFNESDHPRDADGKFSTGSNGSKSDKPKHSPEQMAKWAEEKRQREHAQIEKSTKEREEEKARIVRKVESLKKSAMAPAFSQEEIDDIENYYKAGDSKGAQEEARNAVVSAIERSAKDNGLEIEHVSKSQGDKSKSLYIRVGRDLVRVSDHELPITPERMHNREQGLIGKWDREVIISDWQTTSLADYIAEIKNENIKNDSDPIEYGNELDIARAIQSGELASPQQYENIWLFDVRVTGTGTSYRHALEEYVYRPPENFLTDDFLQRCNGLPLIFEHPDNSILNTDEWKERSIGNVILPYIKGDEVWGIAKVYDADAAQLMQTTHKSTSPAVVFRKAGSTETIELDDGKSVLIEGVPSYLDHLAVCTMGVWDKGGDPTGINLGEDVMAEAEKVPAWADSLMKRMDSIEEGMKADKGRKDDDEEKKEEEAKKADSEKSEAEMKDDKARKDAEDEEKAKLEKERKDAEEFMDSAIKMNDELKAQIAAMQAEMAVLKKPLSADDRDQLSKAQARADSVAQMFGDSAAAPLQGESPINYRKRLAAKFQKHSKDFADIKLDSLDGVVFDQIESKIYADAEAHAKSPAVAVAGRLIPHVRTDSAGRQITTFTGDPDAWMGMFKSKPIFITGINREGSK